MLTEQQLRQTVNRRTRVVLPALLFAIVAVFAYLPLAGCFRDSWIAIVDRHLGKQAAEFAPVLMILPAFAIFLIPCVLAENYTQRFKSVCPSCATDITRATRQVIATRCCSACGERIVAGGRVHALAAYQRQRRIQSRSFLKYWLWVWPCFSCVCLTWYWFDPSTLQRCQHFLFLPALVGTVAAGWAWMRTCDPRYTAPLLASSVLFVLGGFAFWQAG